MVKQPFSPLARGRFSLPALAVSRPVTMLMAFLSMTVVGLVAWRNIPRQLFPEGLNPPYLYVWLFYPNASPMDNLQRIGRPVEEALWTVKGIKRISSRINTRGSGHLLEFQQTADMDLAYLEVRDRLERLKPDLPEDLRQTYIWRYSEADEPILYCAVSVTEPYEDPYGLIQDAIVRPLERVDGVAKVENWGINERVLQVDLSRDGLLAHRLNPVLVISELRKAHFTLSAGTVEDADREVMVRVDGRLTDLDAVRNLPLPGGTLRLSDVADVRFAPLNTGWVERINGLEAAEIAVYKTSDANAVELCRRINTLIASIRADPRLSGIQIEVLFDQGKYITESLRNLQDSGIWGAILAVAVLWFFLRQIGSTLLITAAIPFTLMAAITIMFFLNWSLNIITLSGLMISVGMVVDNAIVVVENIQTCRQRNLPPEEAAVRGAHEVALAVTMATLTTVVVFLPLMVMSSNRMISFFMLRIGVPVVLTLLFSLILALMLIPLAVQRSPFFGKSRPNPAVDAVAAQIASLTSRALRRRRDVVVITLLAFATIGLPISKVVSTDVETGHINDFRIAFHFPGYYALADVDSIMRASEQFFLSRAEAYGVKTVVTGFRRGMGRIRVFVQEPPQRLWISQGIDRTLRALHLRRGYPLAREQIIAELKEQFKPPPGVEMTTSWSTGERDDAVYISIFGPDPATLVSIGDQVKARLASLPNLLSVQTDLEPDADEIQIRFRREDAAHLNLDLAASAFGLTALLRGIDLPQMHLFGREIQGRVALAEPDRQSLRQILQLPVTGGTHPGAVTLASISDAEYGRGVGEITRENRQTRVRLKITSLEKDLGKLERQIEAAMKEVALPPGYDWGKGARFEEAAESSGERSHAWLLAATFVLLIMGALFESLVLPWAVILVVPFSFFGVWWFLYLTGTQFGIMAVIGVVVLIGVVVNNAIVLVDLVNRLRKGGMSREEALVAATQRRLRPIAMTAATTIVGLIPMAVGDASLIGLPYAPMGRAIIGGMLVATFITPVIVPVAYAYADDFAVWLKRFRAKVAGGNFA